MNLRSYTFVSMIRECQLCVTGVCLRKPCSYGFLLFEQFLCLPVTANVLVEQEVLDHLTEALITKAIAGK